MSHNSRSGASLLDKYMYSCFSFTSFVATSSRRAQVRVETRAELRPGGAGLHASCQESCMGSSTSCIIQFVVSSGDQSEYRMNCCTQSCPYSAGALKRRLKNAAGLPSLDTTRASRLRLHFHCRLRPWLRLISAPLRVHRSERPLQPHLSFSLGVASWTFDSLASAIFFTLFSRLFRAQCFSFLSFNHIDCLCHRRRHTFLCLQHDLTILATLCHCCRWTCL